MHPTLQCCLCCNLESRYDYPFFLLLLPPPTSEGYVIIFVGLFVYFYLSVSNFVIKCLQGFSLLFGHGTRKNLEGFDDDTLNPLNTGFLFSILSRKSVSVSNSTWNTWTDFYEIVRTGRETKKHNLKYSRGGAVNRLDPGKLFLFSGFVLVSNVMEKTDKGICLSRHRN